MEALQSAERVILQIGLPLIQDIASAGMLTLHLVGVAKEVLRRVKVSHVFAEGGATAVALARQMDWHRLEVTAELAPGVVTLSTPGESSVWFTMKPGTYEWPENVARSRPR